MTIFGQLSLILLATMAVFSVYSPVLAIVGVDFTLTVDDLYQNSYGWNHNGFGTNEIAPTKNLTKEIIVTNGGAPMRYGLKAQIMGGSEAFCNGLQVTIFQNGSVKMEGNLPDFDLSLPSNQFYLDTGGIDTWKFVTGIKHADENLPDLRSKSCEFNFVFNGYQDRNFDEVFPDGGFSDTEIDANVIVSGVSLINSAPQLSFPLSGPYAGDGINPNSGDTETRFSVRVVYQDADDDTPIVRYCVQGTSDDGFSRKFCSGISGDSRLDYAIGQEMLIDSSFGLSKTGKYEYFFDATDGVQYVRLPEQGGLPLQISNELPNQPPILSRLEQWDGSTSIIEGWIMRSPRAISFSADVNDPNGDQIQLQVELRRFEESFTGTDDGGILTSDLIPSGLGTIRVTRASLSDGKYHWRARAIDSNGNKSEWREFGVAENVDFEIRTKIPVIIIPGIMGTRLDRASDGENVWPNGSEMLFPGDEYLDDLKLTELGQEIVQISPADILREEQISIVDSETFEITVYTSFIYRPLIESFLARGYIENVDLFVAPYDWRLDVQDNINLERDGGFDDKIQSAIANSPTGKIDIVAHSMGGILANEYFKHRGMEFVNKLVLIGVPKLGAPKAFQTLNFGDNDGFGFSVFGLGFNILNEKKIKEISQNMKSAYELLPSRRYLNLNSIFQLGYVGFFGGGTSKWLNYDETKQIMINEGRNEFMLNNADVLHQFSDETWPDSPNIYQIIGCLNTDTVGAYRFYDDGKIKIDTTRGDGTVPLVSAVNAPILNIPEGGSNYFVTSSEVDHMGLVKDIGILNTLHSILNNEVNPTGYVSTSPSACFSQLQSATRLQFSTHSPVELHIYDALGSHTGPDDNGGVEIGIPNSNYERIKGNSFAFVPPDGEYRVVIDALSEGDFNLEIKSYNSNSVISTATYLNVGLAGNETVGELFYTDTDEPLPLLMDNNGNGAADNVVMPTAILSPEESADIEPPAITMTEIPDTVSVFSPITLNFSATDDLSGVAFLSATFDGTSIENGDKIRLCTVGEHVLRVETTDRNGNPRISEQIFEARYPFELHGQRGSNGAAHLPPICPQEN
uniref:Lecithin:cholesterol acyltransferase n=2 Tax=Candidatus Giovannoniibacteriota TaxID=1752738 RepID=A0A0G0ZI91_9BACT|nr:MAG: hypothetical protein UV11_C0009G0009 [Candidatus Giovannonibacteria bacterium GW2011_GWF2_42_19]